MNRLEKFGMMVLFVLAFVVPHAAFAEDFFDTLNHSVTTDTETGISTFNAIINGATITGSWNDTNLDGELDDGESIIDTVNIFNKDTSTSGTPTLQTDADVTSRAALETWAEDNATTILGIIFPGGLEDATGATSDATLTQATFGRRVLKKVETALQKEAALSNFKGALEYQKLDVNDTSGNAYSLIMGYSNELESGYELGFTLPYRYADMSDSIDTKSHYLGLDLYGKKAVREWDDMAWNVGMELFGSITYATSDAIKHAGSLKYGAGIFTSFVKELERGAVSVGLDCRISSAYVPSSLIDDDNTFVKEAVEYVNNLDSVKTITYGINYGIPFKNDTMAVNLEIFRSNYISNDISSEKNAQTVAGIYYSYYPTPTFVLDIGVHNSFELEDIDVFGIVVGAVYKF